MITELKPTNLIAVEVAQDASNYRFESKIEVMYDTEDNIWQQGDFELPPIISYKILGEVTKDKIGFDVESYLTIDEVYKGDKMYLTFGTYYSEPSHARILSTTDTKESFLSLLAANGLYFENHIPDTKGLNPKVVKNFATMYQQWKSIEDKLIKGKLLILEKI